MGHYTYLGLMAGCLLITAPLEWVFGARVYRRPKRLLVTLLPVVAVFVVWDAFAIIRGHWWFSPAQTTGWRLGVIPVEELAFFVVIPICGLLTLEAVEAVGRRFRRTPSSPQAARPADQGGG